MNGRLTAFLAILALLAVAVWLLFGAFGCAASARDGGEVGTSRVNAKVGMLNTDHTQTVGGDVVSSGTPWYVSVGMIGVVLVYVVVNEGRDWHRRRNGQPRTRAV